MSLKHSPVPTSHTSGDAMLIATGPATSTKPACAQAQSGSVPSHGNGWNIVPYGESYPLVRTVRQLGSWLFGGEALGNEAHDGAVHQPKSRGPRGSEGRRVFEARREVDDDVLEDPQVRHRVAELQAQPDAVHRGLPQGERKEPADPSSTP